MRICAYKPIVVLPRLMSDNLSALHFSERKNKINMDSVKHINSSNIREAAQYLRAGDELFLSGTVYSARDAAHKRMLMLIELGAPLPFDLKDAVIYYCGPTPARPGMPIGSCGPTTSSRMDSFMPKLLSLGLAATIGKGNRSEEVRQEMIRHGSIYLCAMGGAGAIAARCITSCEVIAFEELGCESVKKMEFRDFPLVVGIDIKGNSLFK